MSNSAGSGVGGGQAERGAGLARGLGGRQGVEAVGELPGGAVAHEALHEGGVHGMAGALGDDAALDAAAGEGEVADQVEDLVADELVGEAEAGRSGTPSRERMMAQSSEAPRMRPMLRSMGSSSGSRRCGPGRSGGRSRRMARSPRKVSEPMGAGKSMV